MFLFTLFLMEGPPKPAPVQKDVTGHDNSVFTTADENETGLPTITNVVNGKNTPRLAMESSRL